MGKKKDKAAKAAKAEKAPKAAAGLTLPEELRQQGAALLAKANTPAGREMIAAGLTMAAAAATAAAAKHRAKADTAASPDAAAGAQPGEPGIANMQQIAETIGNAAEMMLGRFFGGKKA